MRRFATVFILALLSAVSSHPRTAAAGGVPITLPDGWTIEPPLGAVVQTDTMPQGMAASPDGSTIAVVQSGFNPASLSLYRLPMLARTAAIPLPGAFGRPVWVDARHVLVAGANADALLNVDVQAKTVASIALPKGSYPVYVAAAPGGGTFAVATAGDGAVRIGSISTIAHSTPVRIGGFPGGLAFGQNADTVFATVLTNSELLAIDAASSKIRTRAHAGLHPLQPLLANGKLYVAESDGDSVGAYDPNDLHLVKRISVADDAPGDVVGVSPNALSAGADTIAVSLGAANSVALIRGDAVAGRMQAGWYPTDAAILGGRLYVLNGKGEGAHPNPHLRRGSTRDYVGAIEAGSLRGYDIPPSLEKTGNPQGAALWRLHEPSSVLRPNGPIRHVFFVLKENRSYDQVLGDVSAGNGDARLAWFGRAVTPNEHAIAGRFGLFDNAYTSGEVSAVGHRWTDTAFANDYTQRLWPVLYSGRFTLDDLSHGNGPSVGNGGYIWDAARRAHVSFRDYGELVDPGKTSNVWIAGDPSLNGRFDPHYTGWNLDYSDLNRMNEWTREFRAFLHSGTLPQFEFMWLPNDHTYGSKAGKLTPSAYVATNDYALGRMIDTISHSSVWKSSVIFAIEDDAQDGPDHMSDQRTTLFVVSPYASGGVHHEHYSTVSVLRTIELLLGMKPLSTYDAMARPMYAAFGAAPNLRPYTVIAPRIDIRQQNRKTAYGAQQSARLDFTRPDAIAPGILERILANNHT